MAAFAKSTFAHASYAAFRPSYPPSLYDKVLSHHRGPRTLCLDLGCGTGIATRSISQHFTRAIGTDPSLGMVKQAQAGTPKDQYPNVEFRQGTAESSPFLKDGEVDCVIAAEAAHWFDYAALWPEMRRIVRSGGTVAFWGYKDHVFVDYPYASKVMMEYAYDTDPEKLGAYWPQPGRSYLQGQLRVVQPPDGEWEDVQRVEYEPGTRGKHSGEGTVYMEVRMTVGQCKGYVRTWSSYHGWKERHPGEEARSEGGEGDLVDWMFDEIAEKEGHFRHDENEIDVEWGSAIVIARRKS